MNIQFEITNNHSNAADSEDGPDGGGKTTQMMASNILDLGMLLIDVKVDEVDLTTKKYADTPTTTKTYEGGGGGGGGYGEGEAGKHQKRHEQAQSVLGRIVAQEIYKNYTNNMQHQIILKSQITSI